MEEQALNATLKTLKKCKCIVILDSKSKEAKSDLFFPTTSLFPLYLKILRTEGGGELYIFVTREVAYTFSFLFIREESITHTQFLFIFKF
jgi:3,4-dihydroxy-2-butanone 4-phosphate synthase